VGKKHIESGNEEEDITLDFSKILPSLKKYLPLFLLIIPILLSVYIRTTPERMPIADKWAMESIYNNVKNNIAASLSQQYPNLPQQTAQTMINQQFNLVLSQQGAQIQEAAKQQAAGIRENFADETGYTYLGDIDSYYWMRYAKNIVEKGTYGDEIRDGVQYDNHMSAPLGFVADVNIYPYLEAFLYKLLRIFNTKITLMQAAFYTPLFLSFIAIIAAFLIGRKLSSNFTGFIAAMLVAVNPTILSRSLGSDNDVVNIVFPLWIMLFIIYSFDAKNMKERLIFSGLAGFLTGLYSFAWSGWWFLFLFIFATSAAYIGYILLFELKKEKKITFSFLKNDALKHSAILILTFLVFTYLSLLVVGNQDSFIRSFTNPLKIVSLKEASKVGSIWPNVYTTVAELNEADLNGIIRNIGLFTLKIGKNETLFPLIVLALMGALFPLLLFRTESQRLESIKKGMLILSFFFYLFLMSFAIGTLQKTTLFVFWLLIVVIGYILVKNTTGEKTENLLLVCSLVMSLGLMAHIFYPGNVVVFLLVVSIPFILTILLSFYFNHHIDIKHSIILLLWFLATTYAATKGVRFILIIIPAFVVSFSLFMDIASQGISKMMSRTLGITKGITTLFVVFVLLFLVFFSTTVTSTNIGYSAGYSTAYNYIPSVNDGWVNTLTFIKNNSSQNAIINSWWDFGHWFKYWADRAVTFDGASQNEVQAHWIGKVLLTNDEKQAVGILRMLDCGAHKAFFEIDSERQDTHQSMSVVYDLLSKSRTEAEKEIMRQYPKELAENITKHLLCVPPENYFITSEDMVGKSGVWAHFGSWDFKRAEMYTFFRLYKLPEFVEMLKSQYNYTNDEAQKIFFELSSKKTDRDINDWISPWPSYGGAAGCTNTNGMLSCNIQIASNQVIPLKINMTTKEAFIPAQQNNVYYPNAFAYVENGQYKVKRYNDNQIGYAVALLEDGQTVLLMSEELVDSMFTKLFFFDGIGLKNFKKVYDTRDITGARIITWKIDWPNE
jgi:dolichyl-phosphooligosaccharide-protein glycotransferase